MNTYLKQLHTQREKQKMIVAFCLIASTPFIIGGMFINWVFWIPVLISFLFGVFHSRRIDQIQGLMNSHIQDQSRGFPNQYENRKF